MVEGESFLLSVRDDILEAAQRADAMLEKGDIEGAAVWRRVLKAVEELQRKERREGDAAH